MSKDKTKEKELLFLVPRFMIDLLEEKKITVASKPCDENIIEWLTDKGYLVENGDVYSLTFDGEQIAEVIKEAKEVLSSLFKHIEANDIKLSEAM